MRAIVLDGNENQAVAAVRSLARAGFDVTVGSSEGWSKAGWSRHARGSFTYPSPRDSADAFVERVIAELRRGGDAVVMPMTERTTLPLSLARDAVAAAGGRLALAPHAVIRKAFDKGCMTTLAASLGVSVPGTWELPSDDQARALADTLPYPVVLKPRASEEVGADGAVRSTGAPVYAKNPAELLTAFAELRRRCSIVLVQEFVEGTGAGYFALMVNGEPRAEFAHRRIRDVRPTGSGSALRESVAPDPRVRDAALAILRALPWHGVAMVEFRVRPDGTPVFLEVNGRFWNSLALAVNAGVDFPAGLAALARDGDVAALPPARLGVRCRWLLGDARHLAAVWKGRPAGFPGAFPGRLATTMSFVTPRPGTYHDNFSLGDPLPELGDWLHFFGRRVPAWLRRHEGAA